MYASMYVHLVEMYYTRLHFCLIAMTEWVNGWKQNGWRTCQSKPVKNKEDIILLDTACQKIDVKWVSVT